MDFHFLADALQIFVVTRDRTTPNDLADTGRFHHRIGDANFVDIGGTLYARRNIHVLSEVIDPVIKPHGDGPSSMHTDLQAERSRKGSCLDECNYRPGELRLRPG